MFEKMDPRDLGGNVFRMLGEQWMLITAGTLERCNTMTASWGGFGVMWGMPVAACGIRPGRYTRQFMEENDYYTLSFFPPEYREELMLCGSRSGRDVDKLDACGFTAAAAACGAAYFEQAELVVVCRKVYCQDLESACFVDRAPDEKWYPAKDYHRMYVGEIVEVLKKV